MFEHNEPVAVSRALGLRAKAARFAVNTLEWGRDRVPRGLRTVIGALLMVGGVFGFLPVLGFWMFPLGLAFVALDFPPAQRRLNLWLRRQRMAAGD